MTTEWKCRDCCDAPCCGPVPIPFRVWSRNKEKIFTRPKKTMQMDGRVFPISKVCPFLNAEKKCNIYFERPNVCKVYGLIEKLQCPYIDTAGRIRTEAECIAKKREINNKINDELSRILKSTIDGGKI